MTEGVILDFFLVAVILAALWWLWGARPTAAVAASGSGWREARSRLSGALGHGFRGYYSTTVRQAGIDPQGWRPTYWGAKLAGAALPPLVILELLAATGRDAVGGPWLLAAALAGSFLPDLWLFLARRRRRRQVEQSLAYFLDLVVAFLHSGLSLTAAFRRAGREGFPDPHPLAGEVELVGKELDAGKDPSTAFGDLAERTGVADLRAMAAALRMGLQVGASIRETLSVQADGMWERRREAALRQLQSAEITMMFPLMLMGFPTFLVLALFPLFMELREAFAYLLGS